MTAATVVALGTHVPPILPERGVVHIGQSETENDRLNTLAAVAARGDGDAVAELVGAVQPAIVRYCRARIGRDSGTFASADDAAQEACLGLVHALPGYRPDGRSFTAFAFRIASNKVADHYRKAHASKEAPHSVVPESVQADAGPEQRCLADELSHYVHRLLDHLTAREREILLLRAAVGLSAKETAHAVNMSPGAVRVAQHRATTKLRRILHNRHGQR